MKKELLLKEDEAAQQADTPENPVALTTQNQLSRPAKDSVDDQIDGGYITPVDAEGDYKTFISRIRKDNSNNKAINLWIVSDNLLKGAALNTVQIAEELVK